MGEVKKEWLSSYIILFCLFLMHGVLHFMSHMHIHEVEVLHRMHPVISIVIILELFFVITKSSRSNVHKVSACDNQSALIYRGILLDVSMESCTTTIDGSVRIPLYQPIEGWAPEKILRRAGFAAFGIDGTGTGFPTKT